MLIFWEFNRDEGKTRRIANTIARVIKKVTRCRTFPYLEAKFLFRSDKLLPYFSTQRPPCVLRG
eukprot:UN21281